MFTYVFDLDDTLLSTSKLFTTPRARKVLNNIGSRNVYNYLKAYREIIPQDPVLIKQLIELNGNKYLFTNGSRMHGYCGMASLGISPYFTGQLDSNSSDVLKPDPHIYHLLEKAVYTNHKKTQIVFFDDQYINLVYPKQQGWITVWITPKLDKKKTYADFQFTNIYDGINFFLQIQNLQKRGRI